MPGYTAKGHLPLVGEYVAYTNHEGYQVDALVVGRARDQDWAGPDDNRLTLEVKSDEMIPGYYRRVNIEYDKDYGYLTWMYKFIYTHLDFGEYPDDCRAR